MTTKDLQSEIFLNPTCLVGFQATAFKTIFETDGKKRPLDKRKREKNADPSDIEGYLGPWAKYKDEETVSRPGKNFIGFVQG